MKNFTGRYGIILLLFNYFLLTAPGVFAQKTAISTDTVVQNFTYKIIEASGNTFGYDVFANGKLLIHQATIPGMPGNNAFVTKKDASKVAGLVMEKLQKGMMPPTVTKEELQKLKVIP